MPKSDKEKDSEQDPIQSYRGSIATPNTKASIPNIMTQGARGLFKDLFSKDVKFNTPSDAVWNTIKMAALLPTGCSTIFFVCLKFLDMISAKINDCENLTVVNDAVCQRIKIQEDFLSAGAIIAPVSFLIAIAITLAYYIIFRMKLEDINSSPTDNSASNAQSLTLGK